MELSLWNFQISSCIYTHRLVTLNSLSLRIPRKEFWTKHIQFRRHSNCNWYLYIVVVFVSASAGPPLANFATKKKLELNNEYYNKSRRVNNRTFNLYLTKYVYCTQVGGARLENLLTPLTSFPLHLDRANLYPPPLVIRSSISVLVKVVVRKS